MTQLHINSLQFNYEVHGHGEPLILIGGLTANCREWSRMLNDLTPYFRVYTPENRGAGLTTGWTLPLSIAQMADDISNFMDALGLEKAFVVGHSMGGAILQQLCIHHPERVQAAIIASSFAHFPTASQQYIEMNGALFAAGTAPDLVLRALFTRLYASEFLSIEANITDELNRMLTDPAPQTPEGYIGQVQAIKTFDSRHVLDQIQCPTLIINGCEDLLTPTFLTEALVNGIPNATMHLIPHCGHMLPQEKPSLFSACIQHFFRPMNN